MNTRTRITEEALCILAGRIYGHVGKDRTDCSRLGYDALAAVFGEGTVKPHRPALMVYEGQGPWSPIAGAVAAGIAVEVLAPVPGRMHICQAWKRLTPEGKIPKNDGKPNGHFFFWDEPPTPSGQRALIIQATPTDPPWCYRQDWDTQTAKFPAGFRLAVLREIAQ